MSQRPESGIKGWVAVGFEPVREAFAANFHGACGIREHGAALSVYRHGEAVVDLWGGHADAAAHRPWQHDTLCNVYSTTKGIVAIAVALLADAGRLDYHAPVGSYWPEYACAGKETTTVAQLLSHQAGLSGFREPTTIADLYDWQRCCATLACQVPFHPPGEGTCYHAMTWGFLAGELIRRLSGETVREFIEHRIAGPLDAPVHIGLPEAGASHAAELIAPATRSDVTAMQLPEAAMMALANPLLDPEVANTAAWRAAELPAANGFMSADGLARVYAALANGGHLDGLTLLSPEAITALIEVQSPRRDALLGFTGNWGLGISMNAAEMLGPLPLTFGHGGWGGSFGCANLELGLGIGYVCNRMGEALVGDPRSRALCDAIFGCVTTRETES